MYFLELAISFESCSEACGGTWQYFWELVWGSWRWLNSRLISVNKIADATVYPTRSPHGGGDNTLVGTMKIRRAPAGHVAAALLLLAGAARASLGDRLPEFKECLTVRSFPQAPS